MGAATRHGPERELPLHHGALPPLFWPGQWHREHWHRAAARCPPSHRALQQGHSAPESPLPTREEDLHPGNTGDLLTQSKLFIFRLDGGGSGYINTEAALSE